MGFLEKIQSLMRDLQCEPEHFKDRIMLMSMYYNIEWDTKGKSERCEHYSQTVANYARKFLAFIGLSWCVDQKRNGKELSLADQTDLGKNLQNK